MLKVQLRRFTRKLRVDPWPALEWFVVLLYDRTNSQEHVNDTHKQLFIQDCRTIDALPPTRATLIQHAKRATYQAGYYCWGQCPVAGTRRRLGRDEDPTSRLASPRVLANGIFGFRARDVTRCYVQTSHVQSSQN